MPRSGLFALSAAVLVLAVVGRAQEPADAPVSIEQMYREATEALKAERARLVSYIKATVTFFERTDIIVSQEEYADARSRLVKLGDVALPDIIRALRKTESANALEQLARVIGGIGDPSAVATLVELARESHPGRAAAAIDALGLMNAKASVDTIRDVATSAAEPLVRSRALVALGRLGDETAFDLLERALQDPSEVVRRGAVQAFGIIGRTKDAKVVVPLLDDPDRGVALATIAALRRFGDSSDAMRSLHTALKHADLEYVRAAIEVLGSLSNLELSRPYMRELIGDEARPAELRKTAAIVLYRMGDDHGLDELAKPIKARINRNPRNSTTDRRRLGELYLEFGDWKSAANELKRAVADSQLDYRQADQLKETLARCYARLGNFREARDWLRKTKRGDDWRDLAADVDFVEMAKESKYQKYFEGK